MALRTLASAWVVSEAMGGCEEETVLKPLIEVIRWAEPHAWEDDDA